MLFAFEGKYFVLLMSERLISVVNFILIYACEAHWCPIHKNGVQWTECTVNWVSIGEMYLTKNTLYFTLLGSHALRTNIIFCIKQFWSRTLKERRKYEVFSVFRLSRLI